MPKLNPIITYIVISFVCGVLLGFLVANTLLPPKIIKEPIEVEKYILQESEKAYDSIAFELLKSNKRIADLEKIKYEKIKTHRPIVRVPVTDSTRASNVKRFFK